MQYLSWFFFLIYFFIFFLDSDLFELNCKFLLIWFLFVVKNFFLDFLWSLAFWNFLVLECYWFLLTRLLNFVYFWMPFSVVLAVGWFFILIRVEYPFKCIWTWINFHVPNVLKIFHLFSMFLLWNLWHEVYWLILSFMYNYLKRNEILLL